jgi:hypothetical protein
MRITPSLTSWRSGRSRAASFLRRGLPATALEAVEVDAAGEGLLWPNLDVGISAPGLLEDFFGYPTRAKIARAGGKRSSPAKVAAARANGKKGGRRRQTV